jgi:hypothetical protein
MPGKAKGSASTPRGWREGRKSGWHDKDAPPGLGKKHTAGSTTAPGGDSPGQAAESTPQSTGMPESTEEFTAPGERTV